MEVVMGMFMRESVLIQILIWDLALIMVLARGHRCLITITIQASIFPCLYLYPMDTVWSTTVLQLTVMGLSFQDLPILGSLVVVPTDRRDAASSLRSSTIRSQDFTMHVIRVVDSGRTLIGINGENHARIMLDA